LGGAPAATDDGKSCGQACQAVSGERHIAAQAKANLRPAQRPRPGSNESRNPVTGLPAPFGPRNPVPFRDLEEFLVAFVASRFEAIADGAAALPGRAAQGTVTWSPPAGPMRRASASRYGGSSPRWAPAWTPTPPGRRVH
jgi:hypothetical protein